MLDDMRAITLICLIIVLGNTAQASELYRWVDEQGRVHYSDRPADGAERVELKTAPAATPSPRVSTPAAATRPAPPRPDPDDTAAVAYQSVAIVSPQQDQVLWNIGSVLTVTVDVQPGLAAGHRVVVRYNGQPVEWPAQASSHQVPDVYRGTHTVSVSVTDAAGRVLASSDTVTFHVKQTSVLN